MAQTEIKVIKSPILRIPRSDGCVDFTNDIIYYVKLSNGMIVTRPEDFPQNSDDEAKQELT